MPHRGSRRPGGCRGTRLGSESVCGTAVPRPVARVWEVRTCSNQCQLLKHVRREARPTPRSLPAPSSVAALVRTRGTPKNECPHPQRVPRVLGHDHSRECPRCGIRLNDGAAACRAAACRVVARVWEARTCSNQCQLLKHVRREARPAPRPLPAPNLRRGTR